MNLPGLRVIAAIFCRHYGVVLAKFFEARGQCGGCVNGEVERFIEKSVVSHQKGCAVLRSDDKNAFNSIMRACMLPTRPPCESLRQESAEAPLPYAGRLGLGGLFHQSDQLRCSFDPSSTGGKLLVDSGVRPLGIMRADPGILQ